MRDGIIYDCPHADCRTPIYTGKCRRECLERYNKEMGSKPMTNADRIQEKLAETLSGMCKIAEQCDDCPMEGNCPGGSYDLSVWSKWLQQPAEGE